jgi:hypothetical protein
MEVSGNFLYGEIADQLTPILILKSLFSHVELAILTRLLQQLKAIPIVDLVTIAIESVLLDRAKVRRMRHHCILYIERYDFAGKAGQYYIEVYPK